MRTRCLVWLNNLFELPKPGARPQMRPRRGRAAIRSCRRRFHDFVRNYVLRNRQGARRALEGMLLAPCLGLNRSAASRRRGLLERCGINNGPYNNWFVSSVAF